MIKGVFKISVDILTEEIINDLTIQLKNDPTFDADILAVKVKNAVREVRLKRNYTATAYTDEQIANDLYNYYSVIQSVALYDYNQIGAEGEQSHSENSVSRSWVSRDELFRSVHAFIQVF